MSNIREVTSSGSMISPRSYSGEGMMPGAGSAFGETNSPRSSSGQLQSTNPASPRLRSPRSSFDKTKSQKSRERSSSLSKSSSRTMMSPGSSSRNRMMTSGSSSGEIESSRSSGGKTKSCRSDNTVSSSFRMKPPGSSSHKTQSTRSRERSSSLSNSSSRNMMMASGSSSGAIETPRSSSRRLKPPRSSSGKTESSRSDKIDSSSRRMKSPGSSSHKKKSPRFRERSSSLSNSSSRNMMSPGSSSRGMNMPSGSSSRRLKSPRSSSGKSKSSRSDKIESSSHRIKSPASSSHKTKSPRSPAVALMPTVPFYSDSRRLDSSFKSQGSTRRQEVSSQSEPNSSTVSKHSGVCDEWVEQLASPQTKGQRDTDLEVAKKVMFTVPPDVPKADEQKRPSFKDNEHLLYHLNGAARKIQVQYRAYVNSGEKVEDDTSNEYSTETDGDDESHPGSKMDPEQKIYLISMVIIFVYSIAQMSKRWIHKCFNGCVGNEKTANRRIKRSDDSSPEVPQMEEIAIDGDPALHVEVQAGGPNSGGPTGPTGPAPTPTPGMESAVANTMATQAASSASSGAASGLTGSLAASTIATSTATSALAAATVAASSLQLGTAVAVTASVAIASTVVVTNLAPVDPQFPIISTCGLRSPDFRNANIRVVFEGFERQFDAREQQMMEFLVIDSYNRITRGDNQSVAGCSDEFFREMQNATLTNQTFNPGNNDFVSSLDLTFDAWIICDECPTDVPLFGRNMTFVLDGIEEDQQPEIDVKMKLDMSFLESHTKSITTAVIELALDGELEQSFVPTKIRSKVGVSGANLYDPRDGGTAQAIDIVQLENKRIPYGSEKEVLSLPVGVVQMNDRGQQIIFPEPELCQSEDPEFYPGQWRLLLQGLTRTVSSDEIFQIEQVVKKAYNSITKTGEAECSDSYSREIYGVRLIDQLFVPDAEDDETPSKLEITFQTWLFCKGCSWSIPLFGKSLGNDEFKYDRGMIQAALREFIDRLVVAINSYELPSSMAPTKASVLPAKQYSHTVGGSLGGISGGNNGAGSDIQGPNGDTEDALFGFPIRVETHENGTIVTEIPKPSACGLFDPDLFPGKVRMSFEGFESDLGSESGLMESLVLERYNKLTKGDNEEVGVCSDLYNREMTDVKLADQSLLYFRRDMAEVEEDGDLQRSRRLQIDSVLDLEFDAEVTCDGCSADDAIFGGKDGTNLDMMEGLMESVVGGMVEEVRKGTMSDKFVPEKVYVKQAGGGSEVLLDVPIIVSDDGNGGIFVEFPGPSQAPSISMVPSSVPSDQPSLSMVPSVAPSFVPSDMPSSVPSDNPSSNPSDQPSSLPSSSPSDQPSSTPSESPSAKPTVFFSEGPTARPSEMPSAGPSPIPSESPSAGPSPIPSESPSEEPSTSPSMVPSTLPSFQPSVVPSVSPSMVPSRTPSIAPSLVPSEAPSTQYLGCYADADFGGGNGQQDLFLLLFWHPANAQDCIAKCATVGYQYAGLQNVGGADFVCNCGNSYGGQGTSTACTNFDGNGEEVGGWRANSVYMSGIGTAFKAHLSFSESWACNCYGDGTSPRSLPVSLGNNYPQTGCIEMCKANGYALAGMQNGYECFCGNDVGGYPAYGFGACNTPCQSPYASGCITFGNCYCGQSWKNVVFSTSGPGGCP